MTEKRRRRVALIDVDEPSNDDDATGDSRKRLRDTVRHEDAVCVELEPLGPLLSLAPRSYAAFFGAMRTAARKDDCEPLRALLADARFGDLCVLKRAPCGLF